MEAYTIDKRLIAGAKRALKVIIPLLPLVLDWLDVVEVPNKEIICASLVFVIAAEKALQKDKSTQEE